jgi:hypothetical protein
MSHQFVRGLPAWPQHGADLHEAEEEVEKIEEFPSASQSSAILKQLGAGESVPCYRRTN